MQRFSNFKLLELFRYFIGQWKLECGSKKRVSSKNNIYTLR